MFYKQSMYIAHPYFGGNLIRIIFKKRMTSNSKTKFSFRLQKEIEKLMKNPPSGITCYPKDDNLKVLHASVTGVEGSPYESGVFKIEINVSDRYPFEPPRLRFETKIYHPNIDESGRVCLDMLKLKAKGGWRPTFTIEGLLIAVQYLLGQPNPDDPLMQDIANEFKFDVEKFKSKAREWTKKYTQHNFQSKKRKHEEI